MGVFKWSEAKKKLKYSLRRMICTNFFFEPTFRMYAFQSLLWGDLVATVQYCSRYTHDAQTKPLHFKKNSQWIKCVVFSSICHQLQFGFEQERTPQTKKTKFLFRIFIKQVDENIFFFFCIYFCSFNQWENIHSKFVCLKNLVIELVRYSFSF